MEASWTLMGAVTYLPLDTHWKSKDGTQWTTEKVAEMEAHRPSRAPGAATTAIGSMP